MEAPVTKGSQRPVWSVSRVRLTSQGSAGRPRKRELISDSGRKHFSHINGQCVHGCSMPPCIYRLYLVISFSRLSVSRFLHFKSFEDAGGPGATGWPGPAKAHPALP